MAKTVSVRFSHSSGTTDFYTDETKEVLIDFVQQIDLFRDINLKPIMYKIKNPYKVVKMQIRLIGQDTLDRIQTLMYLEDSTTKQPEVILCYYKYSLDSAVSIPVQMYRNGIVRPFFSGKYLRDTLINLVFYESEDINVCVHRKRIGV